jgi:hypothetical protein
MAQQDSRQPPPQPAEDYRGRPTGPRHEEQEDGRKQGPTAPHPEPTWRKGEESEPRREARDPRDGCHPMDPTERTPGAILDDIPDGDGPRSDAGTNPLPEVYWSAYPDQTPDGER